MRTAKEQSLIDALAFEDWEFLPGEHLGGKSDWRWIRAIVLAQCSDGSERYAVVRYDGRVYRLVKIFGATATIVRAKSIHPTLWLKPSDLPRFADNEQAARYASLSGKPFGECLRLLSWEGKSREQIIADRQEFDTLAFMVAIKIKEDKVLLLRERKKQIKRLRRNRMAKERYHKKNNPGMPAPPVMS